MITTLLRRTTIATALTCSLCAGLDQAGAQAAYTATGPGTYVSVGVSASAFQQDYGHHYIGGGTLFANANLTRRIGVELEFRDLAAHTAEDVKERTYLGGVRYSFFAYNLRPYVKLLAGRGELDFPFHDAKGSYFVVAPAAGLDFRIPNTRFILRAVDFEYQLWPQFTFGELHPYGISSGIAFQVFAPSEHIHGRRFRK